MMYTSCRKLVFETKNVSALTASLQMLKFQIKHICPHWKKTYPSNVFESSVILK